VYHQAVRIEHLESVRHGIVPTRKPQPDGTPIKVLARAWRRQKLLDPNVPLGRKNRHLAEMAIPSI
jgi:hypothetical protein